MQPTASRQSQLAAMAVLLAMTACWGSTFPLIHDLLDRVPTFDFLAVRFLIASATLLLIAPRAIARLSPLARRRALALGLLYGVAQVLQTEGLAHTSASVSGFVTGLYVIGTPLLAAVILRTRIRPVTWVAVAMALTGVGVLTLQGFAIGLGEGLTFVAAMIYALHIVGLGAWSTAQDALGMAVVQCLVITAVCWVAAAPGGVVLPERGMDWLVIVYMAVFAGALALLGQTWAQAHLAPTRSAIIMSMEPVFAAFFAVVSGQDQLGPRMFLGGSLVVAAMLLVEALPGRKPEAEVAHLPQ